MTALKIILAKFYANFDSFDLFEFL